MADQTTPKTTPKSSAGSSPKTEEASEQTSPTEGGSPSPSPSTETPPQQSSPPGAGTKSPGTNTQAEPQQQSTEWQKPSLTMYLAVFSALLGGIGFGFAIGWTAPAFDSLAKESSDPRMTEQEDAEMLSWISSSLTISALIGALASGILVDRCGRRKCLIWYGLPFFVGWWIIMWAQYKWALLLGRTIVGFAVGAASGTIPGYIVDIATAKIRGAIGAFFQLSIVIGILSAFIIGAMVEWRGISVASMIPTIFLSFFMCCMPESPNWLVSKNRFEEAKAALKRIRTKDSDIEKEFQMLVQSNQPKTKDEKTDCSMYLQRKHLHPLILSLGLMIFQQFSGVNAVMFYSTAILKESGSSISAQVGTIIIGAAQVIFTALASALIDHTGRKTLLIVSGTLHVISLDIFAIYYQLTANSTSTLFGWVPVLSMVVFIIGFSIGWGPIPWLMVAEISPNESKSFIASMSTCLNWLCAFVVTKTFKQLQNALSKHGVFYLFSGLSFLSILFTIFALPETKNRTYDEIQKMLEKKAQTLSRKSQSGKTNEQSTATDSSATDINS